MSSIYFIFFGWRGGGGGGGVIPWRTLCTERILESKGNIQYYSKRAHLDMFRSHLRLSNTTVLKKKGTFFIDITMGSVR